MRVVAKKSCRVMLNLLMKGERVTRPSWFCQNGKPDEGEYSQGDNANRNRD
jgi:hypothetical protein